MDKNKDQMIHEMGNHLGVVLGFTELVIETMPKDDPRYEDLMEVRNSAKAAVALLADFGKLP